MPLLSLGVSARLPYLRLPLLAVSMPCAERRRGLSSRPAGPQKSVYIHVFVWFDPAGTRPLNGRSGTRAACVPVGHTAGMTGRLPDSSRRGLLGWCSLPTQWRYAVTCHGGPFGDEKAVWCLAMSWYSTGLAAGVHVSRSVKRIACDCELLYSALSVNHLRRPLPARQPPRVAAPRVRVLPTGAATLRIYKTPSVHSTHTQQ